MTTPALPDKATLLARVARGRSGWAGSRRPDADPPGPGQESVWDYPRPPRVEPVAERLRVILAGVTIADTKAALRVIETASAPAYHFPPDDVLMSALRPAAAPVTVCEWKGAAVYFDIVAGGRTAREAAYAYPDPFDDLGEGYARIAGWPAFYPGRVDEAWFGDERARPQDGGYYAGWVTSRLAGPIKGGPGTGGW
jgi:uncharacterized protein (DUF427 family)